MFCLISTLKLGSLNSILLSTSWGSPKSISIKIGSTISSTTLKDDFNKTLEDNLSKDLNKISCFFGVLSSNILIHGTKISFPKFNENSLK